MKKVIITGSNGVGKSHFAKRMVAVRPEIPVISFDAIKLKSDWKQRSTFEISAALAEKIDQETWILEGGPSLLSLALRRADGLIWLDPPEYIRAWQLAVRPWQFFGQTRLELPDGNVDWPWQQYKFAFRSLKKRAAFHDSISDAYHNADGLMKWRCRNKNDRDAVIKHWCNTAA